MGAQLSSLECAICHRDKQPSPFFSPARNGGLGVLDPVCREELLAISGEHSTGYMPGLAGQTTHVRKVSLAERAERLLLEAREGAEGGVVIEVMFNHLSSDEARAALLTATDLHGNTALHIAAKLGHNGAVAALLKVGSAVTLNTKNTEGLTVLEVAMASGKADEETVELLSSDSRLMRTSLAAPQRASMRASRQ